MGKGARAESGTLQSDPKSDMGDLDLNSAVGFLFRRADSLASRLFYELSGQTVLSPRQFGVLLSLSRSGPLSQRELSDIIHIDPSTLGEILRRMSDRGLIGRRAAREDRRKVTLALTAAGRRTLRTYFPAAIQMQEKLLAPIPLEHQAILLSSLRLLVDRLDG
jgi:Transcriptional regulators